MSNTPTRTFTVALVKVKSASIGARDGTFLYDGATATEIIIQTEEPRRLEPPVAAT